MSNPSSDLVNGTGGPIAPRDPVAKRSELYILHEAMIEATPRPDGTFSQEIYLDGNRLVDKARIAGNVSDEAILELLKSSSGFRRLVHSIGISVQAHEEEIAQVHFTLEHRGKNKSGSRMSISCPADGSEALLILDDFEASPDDDVLAKFAFEFDRAGALATTSVVFYLNDGYRVPELVNDSPVEFESQSYREMIKKSLMSPGNNKRLKAAIEKAKKGESVTIAYIGGSITQGAGAVPIHSHCYAYRSYDLFKQMFAPQEGSSIRLIKAGLGGTPSELGIVRYDRDVLKEGTAQPDIVVVEFAVNDANDETAGNCYESLVLKALNANSRPAVILLFSVFMNDWNLQDRLAPVGRHYDLPMVSVKDAVVEQFRWTADQGKVISKKQFFYDIYHPTNAGHRVMADCLAWLFTVTDQTISAEEDISTDKPPIIGNNYMGIQLLDRLNGEGIARIDAGGFRETDTDLHTANMDDHTYGTPQFPNNWMHTAKSGVDRFRMTLRSKRLILVFKDSGDPEFGTANLWVDGRLVRQGDPHIANWTHCNAVILYDEQDLMEHTVEIEMAAGQEDKHFTILGFGYVL